MTNTIRFAFAGLLTAGLLAHAPARAQDAVTTTVPVQVGDLNLATPAGVATLRHRIRMAARLACGPSDTVGLDQPAGYSSCLVEAEQTAFARSEAMIASARPGMRLADASGSH